MSRNISQHIRSSWQRALSGLLALVLILGLFPAAALAAEPDYEPTGNFELPIAGATGWNGTRQPLPLYSTATGDEQAGTIPASDGAEPVPFTILADSGGDRVKIGLASDTGNTVGWVEKEHIFINLPDVLPSIAYDLSGGKFRAVDGRDIPSVTGIQTGAKKFSSRLTRFEYVVPCMYTLAARLAKVQRAAMSNGETLVLYEAFRPASVQSAVCDAFGKLQSSDSAVKADMDEALAMGYGQGWSISDGTSNHQAGLAVDVSLAKGGRLDTYALDGVTYQKYGTWTEYEMPTPIHELSSASIRFTRPASTQAMPGSLENWTDTFASSEAAQRLQTYCTDAGLIPLSSEWWHFNDPNISHIMPSINTAGDYVIDTAPSMDPSVASEKFSTPAVRRAVARASSGPTGGVGAHNPGSPGGQKPTTTDLAWSVDSERTFLRFTMVEFPYGVVTGLTDPDAWKVVGKPLNVIWSHGLSGDFTADECRSRITWYNSNALQYNAADDAAQLMGGTIAAFDATTAGGKRQVMTADEFQAATGISNAQKEQMFNCHSANWTSGWVDGDYTSMWGTDPHPVTPSNLYQVYKANDAFLYLLERLAGWSRDEALSKWSSFTRDTVGNFRTRYRIIVETGNVFQDPDGVLRAYTLRDMMAYTLYNNEPSAKGSLIYDQSATAVNTAQWMRQAKDHQFLEYPLDEDGVPTGEELHSYSGFAECDSFVDTIQYARPIRDTIFSERRSYGLHIFSPFNFESDAPVSRTLEVTKKFNGNANKEWSFTVDYTAGRPVSLTASKSVTEAGDSIQFKLKTDETIRIDFIADSSFRYEVREDDASQLANINGTGGTADMSAKKFTSGSGNAKVTFTNRAETAPPDEPDPPTPPAPVLTDALLYKRDAQTNRGIGPATFRFSSVTNGTYDLTTDTSGSLEKVQWWDPTGAVEGRYIRPGEYTVTELIPPTGYLSTNAVKQLRLELDSDGDPIPAGPLVFQNYAKPGLRLIKTDSSDLSKTISGARFRIEAVDGSYGPEEFVTDGDGEIDLGKLPTGAYVVTELECPGYIVDDAQRILYLRANDTAQFVFTNTKLPSLRLVKTSTDGAALEGVTFRIAKIEDGTHYLDRTTDANGEILVDGLEPGIYSIVETAALPDHILDTKEHHVELVPGKTAEIRLENSKRPVLTIHKRDADTGEAVPDTVFLIRAADGHSVDEVKTDSSGKAVLTNLLPGVYEVSEKSVPSPYLLDAPSQLVTLYPNRSHDVYFVNHKVPVVTIVKEDSVTHSRISGAKFQIWWASNKTSTGELRDLGVYYTDRNGEIPLEVEDGWLKIQELAPAPGYTIQGSGIQELYVAGGERRTVVFENTPKNAIIVEKYDSVTGEALPGCTFQLRYLGGASGTGGTVIGEAVTGSNGTIIWAGLEPGAYIVVETDLADGYSILQSSETVFLADSEEQSVVTVRFENAPDGALLIRKVCAADPSVTLQNAEFKVTYADGTLIGDSNGVFRTDENGEIRISGLKPDKSVVVTETRAPDGFLLDTQSQTVQIKEGRTVSLTFKNQPKGQLILQKRDSVTGQPLPGAEFRITTAAGCEVGLDGVIGSSTLTQNGIFTTDAQGEIRITGLVPGAYVLTEIKAPEGYTIDTPSTNVVIGQGGDTQTIVIKNSKLGSLLITKKDAVTGAPLSDVEFLVTTSDGTLVGSANGKFVTDSAGTIQISGLAPGTTLVVKETRAKAGYILDDTAQTVKIKANETVTLEFRDQPIGGLQLIKTDAGTGKRLAGCTFEVRRMDDGLVGTYTTDKNGTFSVPLEAGSYYAIEVRAPKGYKLDSTPHYFEVKDGKTTTLRVTNKKLSGILIHKVDSTTGEGIYGVSFLLYDSNKNPIGQYTSDDSGLVYIEELAQSGRYYLRELENEGYIVDTQLKTVYVQPGKVVEIEWENTPITGQIQIIKTSADYNSVNGWPAGTPIPNTVFEIYNERTGRLVDTIKTDKNGAAASRPLPLGRYRVVEAQAADFYSLDKTPIQVEIEFAGQIVKAAMTNKSLYTNVSITKTGYVEVMPGQSIRYTFQDIANNSTTTLNSFYWRDILPVQAVRLEKIVTGTYNVQGSYKIVYKTNLNSSYRTMYDSLSTQRSYTLEASAATLGLAANEHITEVMFVFGVVPAGFRQVEAPQIYCTVTPHLTGGAQFTNQADVGGIYNGQWIMAVSRWTTKVYAPAKSLPRTGH